MALAAGSSHESLLIINNIIPVYNSASWQLFTTMLLMLAISYYVPQSGA
jgi:hypothetical protein